MNEQMNELSQRVQKLEAENKRLKRLGIGAAVVVGAVGLMSAASTMCNTVSAERFVLRDANGRDRAVMTAYETGGVPNFSLLDASGKKALTFGVSESGQSYIELSGKAGPVRSNFAVSPEGQATIEKSKEVASAAK
jgi:hypothetical protein